QSPVSRLPAGIPGGRKIAAAAFRRLAFEPAYGNAADGATFQNLLFAKGETEVMNGTVEIEDTGHPKSRRERQSSHP
ncbi:MAG: hypothetical protein ACREDA_04570, partial [Methylocella sp.]